MHNDNVRNPRTPRSQGGEPSQETVVQSACLAICNREFTRKSCAKILLAYVTHKNNSSKLIKAYVILDEQCNRPLGKKELFDTFDINYKAEQCTIASCSRKTIRSGRRLSGLSVESLDGSSKMDLPTIRRVRCDTKQSRGNTYSRHNFFLLNT